MNNKPKTLLTTAIIGCLTTGAIISCTDNTEPATNSGGEVTEEQAEAIPTGYTLFPATGSVDIEERFEVRVISIENGEGQFQIDDRETGDSQSFDLALGDTAEYGGWTFEVVYLFDGSSAKFTATSPDGEVFPPQG